MCVQKPKQEWKGGILNLNIKSNDNNLPSIGDRAGDSKLGKDLSKYEATPSANFNSTVKVHSNQLKTENEDDTK